MTDEEIGDEFRECADKLCAVLNKAGKAGLQISIKFAPYERADGLPGGPQLTRWHSSSTLSRVISV